MKSHLEATRASLRSTKSNLRNAQLVIDQVSRALEKPSLYEPKSLSEIQGGLVILRRGHAELRVRYSTLLREERALRAASRATRVLDWLDGLLPRRITGEDLGDAIELISAQQALGRRCGLWFYLKMLSTIFWLIVNAVREVSAAAQGKKTNS